MLTSHNWSPWPAIPQGSVSFCHLCRTRKVCETLPPSTVFLSTQQLVDALSPHQTDCQLQNMSHCGLCCRHRESNSNNCAFNTCAATSKQAGLSHIGLVWYLLQTVSPAKLMYMPQQACLHVATAWKTQKILIFVKKKHCFKKFQRAIERRPQCFCSSSEINNLNRPN